MQLFFIWIEKAVLFYSIDKPLHNLEYLVNYLRGIHAIQSLFAALYAYCHSRSSTKFLICVLPARLTNIQTVHKYTVQHSLWSMIHIVIYSYFHALQMKGRWEPNINVWLRFIYSQKWKWNCVALLFPKQNYNVLSPNFHIYVYLSNFLVCILLQPNRQTDPENI